MVAKIFLACALLLSCRGLASADEFGEVLKPIFTRNCVKCHGGEKVKGKVNLKEITSASQFLAKPKLIEKLIGVIEAGDMPPEDEPALKPEVRAKLLATLQAQLQKSASVAGTGKAQIRRLNRFQYNYAVKDLFQLKTDVFPLPEKLMTRSGNYLGAKPKTMPEKVNVACLSLQPALGLRDVIAFPKDLRAAHGFDNQANQLSLSPLLLDSFLKLSVSIVESPDFNEGTVGIWNTFFKAPEKDADIRAEITKRLKPFLNQAFRSPVDAATLDRYTSYAVTRIQRGLPFTEAMKKVASAALSSPLFLHRYGAESGKERPYELASNLSFFLWGSLPDAELLRLAETGEIARPEVLQQTVERMITDPKIERFLDTFPAQWMQLENVLSARPDPAKARLFKLENQNPASTHMVLEPLLLFEAVFLENRPIVDLIKPGFAYQSDFLKTWYTSELKPPPFDTKKIVEENRLNAERTKALQGEIQKANTELDSVIDHVRARLLAERTKVKSGQQPVDLKPYAAWAFDGNLKDSVGTLDLTSHGKVKYQDGMVVLESNAFLQSKMLPIELKAKTLEVWCKVHDLEQNGGGLMGLQGPKDVFDTIVLGERRPNHWISGSDGFRRTEDFPESTPEDAPNQKLHFVMVYAEDGTTTLYRNGVPYGKPFRKGAVTFPKDETSVLFGIRHLPAGGGRHLFVSLAKARLYDRALTAAEVAASRSESPDLSREEIFQAMAPEQQAQKAVLSKTIEQAKAALKTIPKPKDPAVVEQEAARDYDYRIVNKLRAQTFERVPASDPRYGGIITTAAMATMTSGSDRTHPIARGAWVIEVILNDPPEPPPNNVPPLNETESVKDLTIREKFAEHRKNPDCAGCHTKLDPLGFALENFDLTGRWRDKYENGRDVDASGTLMRKHDFKGIVDFKESLVKENRRFANAFTAHLLRFALARELTPADSLTIAAILKKTEAENFKLQALIGEVICCEAFLNR